MSWLHAKTTAAKCARLRLEVHTPRGIARAAIVAEQIFQEQRSAAAIALRGDVWIPHARLCKPGIVDHQRHHPRSGRRHRSSQLPMVGLTAPQNRQTTGWVESI